MIQTVMTPEHYTGNGTLTNYSFSFRILKKTDLLVQTKDTGGTVTDLTLDTDYTIAASSVNNSSGGEIVLAVVLATGIQLFLTRQTALTQLVHIEEGAPFPSSVVEEVFDRLTMFAQELKYLARQTLHFPTTSTIVDITVADPEAGQILTWDSTATEVVNALASTLDITHVVVDVPVNAGASSAVITHNLDNSNAKIIGFSSTFHTAFRTVSQTANTITIELTVETPPSGGTLTFEVGV